jgi:23S rRNA (guanosine2251-2'-O)-methyltransferase
MSDQSILYGLHAVSALLEKQPQRITYLAILKDRIDAKMQALISQAESHAIKIEFASRHGLDKIARGENHQGIIAFCRKPKIYSESDLENLLQSLSSPAFLLILDGVQDPHNLGACLRSAEALGVHAVIAPRDKSVGLTPVVCKVASGAAETIPFMQVTNLARTLRFLKEQNIWIYGADGAATKRLDEANMKVALGIVMGGEGAGLRRLTKEHCDELFSIPMRGAVSSLNVSVATGIFLYEVVRQRVT